jgi:transposase
MGRSRGGLTTKIHALVDANGLPIALKLSEGQAHDGKSAQDLLTRLEPGQILLADRAYDSDALRQDVASQGAWANIKPMPGRVRIPALALSSTAIAIWSSGSSTTLRQLFQQAALGEALSWLRSSLPGHRNFEKRDGNYLALIKLASVRTWMLVS